MGFVSRARRGTSSASISGAHSSSLATFSLSATATIASGGESDNIHASAFASDTFGYANTTALRGSSKYYVESLWTNIHLDTSVTYNGHPTARVDQTAGVNGISKMSVNLSGMSDVWFRWKDRHSPGWTTAGSLVPDAYSCKYVGFGWSNGDGRGDLEYTNTDQLLFNHYAPTNGANINSGTIGSESGEWDGDAWWDKALHYRRISSTAIEMAFWRARDGQTLTRVGSVWNGSPAASGIAQYVGFPFYFNQTPTANQSLWFANWQVVNGATVSNPWGLS